MNDRHGAARKSSAVQNPAYRLIRHFSTLNYFVINTYQLIFSISSPDCVQNVSKVFSKPSPFSMIRRTRSRNSFVNGAQARFRTRRLPANGGGKD